MKNIFNRIFGALTGAGKAWWVEVKTSYPACTYYFGPFSIAQEAQLAQKGYIEDLEQEGAQGIQAGVVHCPQPANLTVYDEHSDGMASMGAPAFSGQP